MEVSANDIECIICTAATENSLLETVEIVRSEGYVPIVECKYSIDPEVCSWTAGTSAKGVIWYMKDANGNECNYDFKHVKFRRWAVTDVTPNDTSDTGSGNPGAYAYCVTNSCYNWSDNRDRIGSGEPEDATIVKNVFAGTWARCTADLSSSTHFEIPSTFHSDYALYCHKPYKKDSPHIDQKPQVLHLYKRYSRSQQKYLISSHRRRHQNCRQNPQTHPPLHLLGSISTELSQMPFTCSLPLSTYS